MIMRSPQKPKIGLVVALANEMKALTGGSRAHRENGFWVARSRFENEVPLISVCSGVGLDRARRAAEWLVSQDVTILVNCGVSGGLNPNVAPGDLVIAETVIEAGIRDAARSLPTSRLIGEKARALMASHGLITHAGPIVSAREGVFTKSHKARLYHFYKAVAVDMESAAVVQAARQEGLPVLVLRAICDPADMNVSPDIFACVDSEGRLRPWFLIGKLLRHPTFITDLWQNRQTFTKAMHALKAGWGQLAADNPWEHFS